MIDAKPRPMSRQQAFDNMWRHFITEGHPRAMGTSVDRGEFCVYRTDDGKNGCGIGCQMSDDVYDAALEGISVQEIVDSLRDAEESVTHHPIPMDVAEKFRSYFEPVGDWLFLQRLQEAHDGARDGAVTSEYLFEARLRRVAHTYGLTIPA